MRVLARELCSVLKLRIGVAITVCALAGLAVTPGDAPPAWQIAILALAVLLSSASAGAFNHYVERDLDARMARTRNRPFVTGRFRPSPQWLWAIGAMLVTAVVAAALVLNLPAALHTFLGAFVYGVVYTVWLKRRTAWNIVVGGLAGSFAVLAGASAVDPALAPAPVWLAVVLFLWTPPHFWSLAIALHDDYATARVPMLPVVVGDAKATWIILFHTIAVVLASLVPALYGMGWLYVVAAVVGGLWFTVRSIQLVRDPCRKKAMANFRGSLLQLSLLLGAAIAETWISG
ncbi:MAG: protoheme IX farnesyltransferase [Rhodospirillales bacterium]|nr:MAG: protoheme IX farnesyltransferase [Rhodospirillales bacterium]